MLNYVLAKEKKQNLHQISFECDEMFLKKSTH